MDIDWLTELARFLEGSTLGAAVRMIPNLYPVLESIHVIGIALLVGPAIAVDLRLIGFGKKIPVTTVAQHLLPISHVGFLVAAVTGAVMFFGVAVTVTSAAAFPWKFGLIGVAGLNIAIFHLGVYASVSLWDIDRSPPARAKIAGLVSAMCWTGVVFAGRFLAY